jgi:UDP-N-acetylglucosamine acyltransferase
VGLEPQDLKFRGEATQLEIGDRNTIREFVTIHRGTAGGGGLTRIGSDNLFMACAHIAHDCLVGNHTIFGNGAVLAGHVEVMDHASVNAYSGIHQFCRVGPHAYTGGFTVATKDVLPFSKTVGNRAHVYGVNSIGLARRGFPAETIAAIKRAFRVLLSGRLTTTQALEELEAEQPIAEVRQIIDFVRSSPRGVILKRRRRRVSPEDDG